METVLVVDDNPDNVELLCQMLEDTYEMIKAYSGMSCITTARTELPDLILLDVMMPEMDGYQVIQQLQADEETKRIPVIFLSARYRDIDRVIRGLELGALDYITKPFEEELLRAKVQVGIRVKKAEDEIKQHVRDLEELANARSMNELLQREITQRKVAEAALRESEEKYRALFEYAGDAIYTYDMDMRLIDVNKVGCQITGKAKEDVIGQDVFALDILHPEDLPKALDGLNRLLAGEEAVTRDLRFKQMNGTYAIAEVRATPIQKGGDIVMITNVCRDVTEVKVAEQALRENEAKYRAAIEQTTENIYITDLKTRKIIESNDTLQRLLGYTPEEMKELTVYDFISHPQEDIDAQGQRIIDQKNVFIGDRQYRRKDGTIIDVEVSGTHISYGGKSAFCIVSRDITSRKRTEKQLRESEARYRALFDRSISFAYLYDLEGNILDANDTFLEYIGYSRAQISGLNFFSLVAEDQRTGAQENHRALQSSGRQDELAGFRF